MYIDIYGKKRQKLGLHIHTTRSDGRKTPEEVAEIYKSAGYDAIALTDHGLYNGFGEINGLKIISGAEFNVGGNDCMEGVYHMVSLFTDNDPKPERTNTPAEIADKIHRENGIAVIAHPAWSLNPPDILAGMENVDATEIYNSVSAVGESFRPDSSLLVDMTANRGKDFLLFATDDTHFYEGEDNCVSYIMVECDTTEPAALKEAILAKRFYATQGPEIHLTRDGNNFRVDCSPVKHIYFATQAAWTVRSAHGEEITSAEYTVRDFEKYVRAFVIDADGKQAWSNIIRV